MCGIVGYVGSEQAAPILLDGLARLEYRGYDSAGIAVVSPRHELQVKKTVGRLKALSDLVHGGADVEGTIGMGHTRWATHGAPNDVNSHPHVSENGKFAVIHNGIIENYVELKEFLICAGRDLPTPKRIPRSWRSCSSTTTTSAATSSRPWCRVLHRIEGAYALGMHLRRLPRPHHRRAQGRAAAARLRRGLQLPRLRRDRHHQAHARRGAIWTTARSPCSPASGIQLYNAMQQPMEKEHHHIEWEVCAAEKGGYRALHAQGDHGAARGPAPRHRRRICATAEIVLDDLKLDAGENSGLSTSIYHRRLRLVATTSAWSASIIWSTCCAATVEVALASRVPLQRSHRGR